MIRGSLSGQVLFRICILVLDTFLAWMTGNSTTPSGLAIPIQPGHKLIQFFLLSDSKFDPFATLKTDPLVA